MRDEQRTCRVVEIDGEPVRIQGGNQPMSDEAIAALTDTSMFGNPRGGTDVSRVRSARSAGTAGRHPMRDCPGPSYTTGHSRDAGEGGGVSDEMARDFLTANEELGAEVVRLRAQIDADTDEMAADAHHAIGLELAVARVRDLHRRTRLRGVDVEVCHHCGLLEFGGEYDEALWPCKTIRALDGEA